MRMLAVYHKTESARYISHLDVQRTLQRAFRRAKLPLRFSEGFNPHPELSFASALATGTTSDAEWFDVELTERMQPETFLAQVNAVLPQGIRLSDARELPAGIKTLSTLTRAAEYEVQTTFARTMTREKAEAALESLLSGDIIVNKRTKGGIKPVNVRPQIIRAFVEDVEGNTITLRVLGKLQADGGLRVELMMGALFDCLDAQGTLRIHRAAMYFDADGVLPRIPLE